MEISGEEVQKLFIKYRIKADSYSQKNIQNMQQTLNQIIQIGNVIFFTNDLNQQNLNLNQGFNQKNQSLMTKDKTSEKIYKKTKCFSERHSQYEKQSVFNLQQDDWISQNNCFDKNFKKKNEIQISHKKQSATQLKSNIKKQNFKHNKLSDQLLKPVRNFKKKVLEDIQQKKKKQQEEFQLIQLKNKSNVSLSQFYQHNKQHLPVYQKKEITQKHKLKLTQERKVEIHQKSMKDVTFKPTITKKAKQINKTFQQRLVQSNNKKELNQKKIILQELKNSPFNPKTNKLNSNYMNTESRVKSIWTNDKSSSKSQTNSQISNFVYSKSNNKFQQKITTSSFKIQQKDIPLFQQFMYQ